MNKKLFIGLPCYDGFKPQFAASLLGLPQAIQEPFQVFQINGDSLIPRARNNLAAEFLDSDASHLLFLDTDLEFPPAAIARLVSHDLDIVGGTYEQKRYDQRIPVFNKLAGEELNEHGLAKVAHVGTGMMLIARHVFEGIIDQGKAAEFQPCHDERRTKPTHEFFPIGVHDGIYESEDWAFCRIARECGYTVWLDSKVNALHHGHAVYPNQAVEQMRSRIQHVHRLASSGATVASAELLAVANPRFEEANRR